jgi:hypothetical protein
VPTVVDVTIDNGILDGCADTVDDALTILPCAVPPCPCATPANASYDLAACPTTNGMAPEPVLNTNNSTATFTVTNTGGDTLIINSVGPSGTPVNATFSVSPPAPISLLPGANQTFTVTANPTAVGPYSGTIRVSTNDPDTPNRDICFSGTAN